MYVLLILKKQQNKAKQKTKTKQQKKRMDLIFLIWQKFAKINICLAKYLSS